MPDSDNLIRTIDATESALNDLFKEVLDGLRDDILEAQTNVDMYQKAINVSVDGKDMYGPMLNAALSVKGSARDRQLKFLGHFKDRVTKKESVELAKELKSAVNREIGVDHAGMNKILEEMKASGELNNINLDLEDE